MRLWPLAMREAPCWATFVSTGQLHGERGLFKGALEMGLLGSSAG